MTASRPYPQPRGSDPHEGVTPTKHLATTTFSPPHPRFFSHHLHLLPHLTPLDQPIERFPSPCQSTSFSPLPLPPSVGGSCPHQLALLSFLFLHPSFHLVGSLYRPGRGPRPRPLSLSPAHNAEHTEGGGGSPPGQTSILMRANWFPSPGLRFPALPAGEARLGAGYLQEESGPRC